MTTTSENFINGLASAARENPLAATLIGGGALWLICGSGAFRGVTSATGAGIRSASDAAMSATRAGANGVASASQAAGSVVRDLYDGVSERTLAAGETVSQGYDRAASALRSASRLVPDHILPNVTMPEVPMPDVSGLQNDARAALSNLLERQPLVLGAVGLAIGAGIASAVAATATEKEWFGETSDKVTSSLRSKAGEVVRTAQDIARDAGSDLTDAASEAVDTLGQAGQRVAQAARSTLADRI
jgi:hypothetical protein